MSNSATDAPLACERAVLYLVVGALLVLAPAAAGPAGTALAPSDAYTYEAVEITTADGTLVFDGGEGAVPDDGIHGIDCLVAYSRLCGLEIDQLDGPVTVRKVNPIQREYTPYVEFDGQFYERTNRRVNDTIQFELRPVPADAVLRNVSASVEDDRRGAAKRRIVANGTATIDHELAAPGQVVRVDGSYYVFDFEASQRVPDRGPAGVVALAAGGGFLLGLWSLRRGWVHYDRWRGAGEAGSEQL